MDNALKGMLAGLLLALAVVAGGLLGLLLAVVLGGVGFALAGHLSGELDLNALTRGRRG